MDARLHQTSADVNRVIQRQIRAFVTVNEELEQASGKKFSWDSVGEITRAIDEATGKEAQPEYILRTKRAGRGGTGVANPSAPPSTRLDPNVPLEKQQEIRAP
jgi:hypothetical protein